MKFRDLQEPKDSLAWRFSKKSSLTDHVDVTIWFINSFLINDDWIHVILGMQYYKSVTFTPLWGSKDLKGKNNIMIMKNYGMSCQIGKKVSRVSQKNSWITQYRSGWNGRQHYDKLNKNYWALLSCGTVLLCSTKCSKVTNEHDIRKLQTF